MHIVGNKGFKLILTQHPQHSAGQMSDQTNIYYEKGISMNYKWIQAYLQKSCPITSSIDEAWGIEFLYKQII